MTDAELSQVETREQLRDAIKRAGVVRVMQRSPLAKRTMAERQRIYDLAKPVYKAELASIPFCQERMNNDKFWRSLAGSAWVATMEVAANVGKRPALEEV